MLSEERFAQVRKRWDRLWNRLRVPAPADGTFDELVAAYGNDQRHYHTLDHVLDCLELLDEVGHLASRPHEIEAAIWFHDAIYDTRRHDNEEASAAWAASTLRRGGVSREAVGRVREMILATRHAGEPTTADEALALDIDLSILGRDRDEFDRYQEQIRHEFDWVPAEAYRSGRSEVLSGFLDREPIYRTEEMQARFGEAARRNLAAALGELTEPWRDSSDPTTTRSAP